MLVQEVRQLIGSHATPNEILDVIIMYLYVHIHEPRWSLVEENILEKTIEADLPENEEVSIIRDEVAKQVDRPSPPVRGRKIGDSEYIAINTTEYLDLLLSLSEFKSELSRKNADQKAKVPACFQYALEAGIIEPAGSDTFRAVKSAGSFFRFMIQEHHNIKLSIRSIVGKLKKPDGTIYSENTLRQELKRARSEIYGGEPS